MLHREDTEARVNKRRHLKIGLIWSQFAAYHIDRCEAVARSLGSRADVLAIEVATTSATYAWEPSGEVEGAQKLTLFPGRSFDSVPPLRRVAAMIRATWNCDVVCMGLSYAYIDAILLSWTLRLLGRRVIMFSESKFDDKQRSLKFELAKSLVLSCYTAAIVGGRRHMEYFRFLGFRKRPVLPGYDGVGTERLRKQGEAAVGAAPTRFEDRPFLFVGRFVDKKNLLTLIEGYARYVVLAGPAPRRLVLVGSGPEEAAMRRLAGERGMQELIDYPGFLNAEAVSGALASALALVLVSRDEQWGLVINEALAAGLPVIVSNEVGSRDLLVRNLVNGFVVESNCPQGLALAMHQLAGQRATWEAMARASRERAWMGDADRLADAIETLILPARAEPANRIAQLMAEMETQPR